MGTKSRETIYGASVRAAAERAAEARKDADRLACEAWNKRMLGFQGPAPKYAAIDILMWLSLTDPGVTALKPGTLMVNILDRDESQIGKCWKCITIIGMSELMNGYAKEAREDLQKAVNLVKRDTGSVPSWLTSRVDVAAAEAAKQNR
jgi:hypothetical protein